MKPKHSGVCRRPSSVVYLSSALDEWIFQAFSFWLQQFRSKRSISWLKPVTPLTVLWIRGGESRRAFVSVFLKLAINLGSRMCFQFHMRGTAGWNARTNSLCEPCVHPTNPPLTRGRRFSFRADVLASASTEFSSEDALIKRFTRACSFKKALTSEDAAVADTTWLEQLHACAYHVRAVYCCCDKTKALIKSDTKAFLHHMSSVVTVMRRIHNVPLLKKKLPCSISKNNACKTLTGLLNEMRGRITTTELQTRHWRGCPKSKNIKFAFDIMVASILNKEPHTFRLLRLLYRSQNSI